MSYSVKGTTITLTRGDTFAAIIEISDSEGNAYQPVEGDSIQFTMKMSYNDPEPLISKDVPIDNMKLVLNPEDTKDLAFGSYVYDIQLTKATGEVDTFIAKAKLQLTEEVG